MRGIPIGVEYRSTDATYLWQIIITYILICNISVEFLLKDQPKVGDLSLKGRSALADFAPVNGWKSESQTVGNTNCRPNTGAKSAIDDAIN
jgi:hypothetical protein